LVTHPRSIIKGYIDNILVAQTNSNLRGEFTLIVPGNTIANSATSISLIAEKVPLTEKAIVQKSAPYNLALIPNQIGGFAYDQKTKVVPNAIVEIIIMDGIVYSTTKADKDGYVVFDSRSLPPFGYKIRIRDPQTGAILDLQKPGDFLVINKPYFSATKSNVYAQGSVLLSKPTAAIVEQIKKTPTFYSANRSYALKPSSSQISPTAAAAIKTGLTSNSFGFLLLFLVLLSLPVGFIIFTKINQKNKELL
jgi:hypothetical protein